MLEIKKWVLTIDEVLSAVGTSQGKDHKHKAGSISNTETDTEGSEPSFELGLPRHSLIVHEVA